MLTQKEQEVKNFMIKIYKPTLYDYLQSHTTKEKWEKWGGNFCRQMAVFGASVLSGLLNEYEWHVWDGIFDDIENGQKVRYNHAWILGRNKEGKRLFVDLARLNREDIFEEVPKNVYPALLEYIHMKEVSRKELDWKKLIQEETEYYTNKPSTDILWDINMMVLRKIL